MGVLVANLAEFRRTETRVSTKLKEAVLAAAQSARAVAVGHFQRALFVDQTLLAEKGCLETVGSVVRGKVGQTATTTKVALATLDARFALYVFGASIVQLVTWNASCQGRNLRNAARGQQKNEHSPTDNVAFHRCLFGI